MLAVISTLAPYKPNADSLASEIGISRNRGTHQAMDDIRESVAELAYYRENFIKL